MDDSILYCSYCGKIIPPDSRFCRYCGRELIIPNSTNFSGSNETSTIQNTPYHTMSISSMPASNNRSVPRNGYSSNEQGSYGILKIFAIGFAILIILIFLMMHSLAEKNYATSTNIGETNVSPAITSEPAKPALHPIAAPANGYIFKGASLERNGELTIISSSSDAYVIKLKKKNGIDRFSFYVAPGSNITMKVPTGQYYVYFASGSVWYGITHLFGENTSYSKDSELLDFENYTFTYTLYPVTDGNFKETPISAADF